MESILSHLKDSTEKLSDREVVTKRIRSFSELRDSLKSLSQLTEGIVHTLSPEEKKVLRDVWDNQHFQFSQLHSIIEECKDFSKNMIQMLGEQNERSEKDS